MGYEDRADESIMVVNAATAADVISEASTSIVLRDVRILQRGLSSGLEGTDWL